jgi:hypothetical protein
MKTDRVVLDKAEADWFSRNVLKTVQLLEARAAKEPAVLERRTYRVCKSLVDQATTIADILAQLGTEPYEVELQVKAKQRQAVGSMLEMTVKSLEEKILPEYERRGLKQYQEMTAMKVALLKTMRRKFV